MVDIIRIIMTGLSVCVPILWLYWWLGIWLNAAACVLFASEVCILCVSWVDATGLMNWWVTKQTVKLFIDCKWHCCCCYWCYSHCQHFLSTDFGSAAEFASLSSRCYEFSDATGSYIYSLCPFDRVVQRSKSTGLSVMLGWAYQA